MKSFVLKEKEIEYYKKYAISKGFTHVKFEFEAQLDRGDGDSEYCEDCSGDGYYTCESCDDGNIEVSESETEEVEYRTCEDCDGTARISCDYCGGSGYCESDGYSEEYCDDYIRSCLSTEARQSMVYGNFYNDGSVDSEYTCTFRVEDLQYGIEVCNAFESLADEIGNGMDTSNAGFHMALMTSGDYPRGCSLESDKLRNYKKSMTKLIPALVFLGASNSRTRGFGYRQLQISSDKYSLINTGNSVLEFRVFDTCYGRAEHIYDNFIVMAKSLQFYSDTYIEPVFKTKAVIDMYSNDYVQDFYYTSKHLDILEQSLKYLRPTYKTLAQLKEERLFSKTKKALIAEQRERINVLRNQYADYVKDRKKELARRKLRAQYEYKVRELDGEARGTMKEYVKNELSGYRIARLSEYIRDNSGQSRWNSPLVRLEY